ncbi:hypothetical protein EDB19DRAFT_1681094 [Suillus lakei]|nr:hypothetical protein EDB19DRAFT_1709483 [Suillus lakei]KAG1749574.1 hypothetical protein EDB19DRAFT_1681094 [Suillus lakei]
MSTSTLYNLAWVCEDSGDIAMAKEGSVRQALSKASRYCSDFCTHGVDILWWSIVTFVLLTESVAAMLGAVYKDDFPTELADTYNTSLPWTVVRRLHQRMVPMVAETADKEILDGLATVGFKTNLGIRGAGIMSLFLERSGGYYIVLHRKWPQIADGTELQADVKVFSTGYGDLRDFIRVKITRVWGLDEEGQSTGVWRYCGHDGVWFANDILHLALQIKAIEEGILKKADVVI